MLNHINDSEKFMKFLADSGITVINDDEEGLAHNTIKLMNRNGDVIELWAESEYSVANGIPGIYIEE